MIVPLGGTFYRHRTAAQKWIGGTFPPYAAGQTGTPFGAATLNFALALDEVGIARVQRQRKADVIQSVFMRALNPGSCRERCQTLQRNVQLATISLEYAAAAASKQRIATE